jgi:hypothetical protein
MSIDFLNMNVGLQRALGFRVPFEAWQEAAAGRDPVDLTAGALADAIARIFGPHRMQHAPRDGSVAPGIQMLSYHAQGPQWRGTPDELWLTVRQVIAETLRVPPERVERDTWLVRDLGMT